MQFSAEDDTAAPPIPGCAVRFPTGKILAASSYCDTERVILAKTI